MIKKMSFAILMTCLATGASADVRIDDLNKFYVAECGSDQFYKPAGTPAPITPRVQSPADAAPWLAQRDWDVRPFKDCPKVMRAPATIKKKHAKPHRAHQKMTVPIK